MEKKHVKVKYEGLSLISFDCGIFEQLKEDFPRLKATGPKVEVTPTVVPKTWMVLWSVTYGTNLVIPESLLGVENLEREIFININHWIRIRKDGFMSYLRLQERK
ncbi:hypothetical protein GOBAR_DD14558 [Gossypium barbadense]|nr:hypothetical protein GOBAR_DD14558 [Gossypium barbadense]